MSMPRPAVKALIERDGRLLLLEQDTGDGVMWTLPGGKVEFGEAPRQALRREVTEEVSGSVKIGVPVGVYDFQYDWTHVVVTVFECEWGGGEVDISSNPASERILSAAWVRPEEAVGYPMNAGLVEVLESR